MEWSGIDDDSDDDEEDNCDNYDDDDDDYSCHGGLIKSIDCRYVRSNTLSSVTIIRRQDLAASANYARFYISRLFPQLKKFIYLDNDIIGRWCRVYLP
jgi:hypothetical protein